MLLLELCVCVLKVHSARPTYRYIEGFHVHYNALRDVTARRRDVTVTSSATSFTLTHLYKYTW